MVLWSIVNLKLLFSVGIGIFIQVMESFRRSYNLLDGT
uniref:Uncharacterized protein n=1 Tax=Rhizophora mucronata TaxID=61149 RepID=A0A2P2LB83_RHIMU